MKHLKLTGILAVLLAALCLCGGCGRSEESTTAEQAPQTETEAMPETTQAAIETAATASAQTEAPTVSAAVGTTKSRGTGKAGMKELTMAAATVVTAKTVTTAPKEMQPTVSTQQDETVYYMAFGKYWHLSEDCAKEDTESMTAQNYKGEEVSLELGGHVMRTTRSLAEKTDRTACPKCVGE